MVVKLKVLLFGHRCEAEFESVDEVADFIRLLGREEFQEDKEGRVRGGKR